MLVSPDEIPKKFYLIDINGEKTNLPALKSFARSTSVPSLWPDSDGLF